MRDGAARFLASAGLAAILGALTALPSCGPTLLLHLWFLLFPISLAASLPALPLLRRLDSLSSVHLVWFGCCGGTLAIGVILSTRVLIGDITHASTLIGYGISVFATGALAVAMKVHWLHWHPFVARCAPRVVLVGVVGLITGVTAWVGHVERSVGYPRFSMLILLAMLMTLAFAATWWMSKVRPMVALGLVGSLLLTFAAARNERSSFTRIALVGWTAHQSLVQALWRWTDRDKDGFSAAFGGSDCDDSDPAVFPLSIRGRDCLGWVSSPVSAQPAPPEPAPAPRSPRPQVIVLLTVDTLRCGFGQDGPTELKHVCPSLQRLGTEGRMRTNAHSTAPRTLWAMRSMHFGELPFARQPTSPLLAQKFAALGYRTHAISTHRDLVGNNGVRSSFDEIDETLAPQAYRPGAVTSHEVSARVLVQVRRALAPGARPLLLWAHYFDPHAPYVARPGNWFSWSQLDNYAAEVRRTDASIGAMAETLRAMPRASDVVVLVTADHGEEFGEHGYERHGFTLYEPALRIPMVAWNAGADHRRFVPTSLPTTLTDVSGFLVATATETTFRPAQEALMLAAPRRHQHVAIVRDGWKLIYSTAIGAFELYDLRTDPEERMDRSADEESKTRELGRRLAHRLGLPGTDPAARWEMAK